MRWKVPVLVLFVPVLAVPSAALADGQSAADEQRLHRAGLKTDPASLLEFFRSRTVRSDPQQVKKLIAQLAARSFAVRERATTGLIALGAQAVPQLEEASRDPDL